MLTCNDRLHIGELTTIRGEDRVRWTLTPLGPPSEALVTLNGYTSFLATILPRIGSRIQCCFLGYTGSNITPLLSVWNLLESAT
jgi:hypothetical protein